jgi:hypothetical protein
MGFSSSVLGALREWMGSPVGQAAKLALSDEVVLSRRAGDDALSAKRCVSFLFVVFRAFLTNACVLRSQSPL